MCADLSDVSQGIVNLLTPAIYPNGTGAPSAIGSPCKIYPGWPIASELDADLAAGTTTVSVYPQPSIERVTTRYPQDWKDQTRNTSTLSAVVSGNTVTISGQVTTGHYITILLNGLGSGINGPVSSYAAKPGDTLAAMAAALVQNYTGNWFFNTDDAFYVGGNLQQAPYYSLGSSIVITFPPALNGRIVARTAAPGTIIRELRRQQHSYQVIIWASNPIARAAVANIIDPILAANDFMTMPDTSQAWLVYRGSNDADDREPVLLYRRDIFYWAEYATTQVAPGYPITAFVGEIEADTGYRNPIMPLPFGANTPGFTFQPSIKVDC